MRPPLRSQRVGMICGTTRLRGAALLRWWAQQENAAMLVAQRLRSCSRRRSALEAVSAHPAGRYNSSERAAVRVLQYCHDINSAHVSEAISCTHAATNAPAPTHQVRNATHV
jgi:hypothetical protein